MSCSSCGMNDFNKILYGGNTMTGGGCGCGAKFMLRGGNGCVLNDATGRCKKHKSGNSEMCIFNEKTNRCARRSGKAVKPRKSPVKSVKKTIPRISSPKFDGDLGKYIRDLKSSCPTNKKSVMKSAKRVSVKKSSMRKTNVRHRGCVVQNAPKYIKRKSPPYPATECCNERMYEKIGNDGNVYVAKPVAAGKKAEHCRWYKK